VTCLDFSRNDRDGHATRTPLGLSVARAADRFVEKMGKQMKRVPGFIGLACWLFTGSAVLAQDANELKVAEEAEETPLPDDEQAYFTSLTWRNIGPDRGGRSISATGSAARPNEFYFTAVGGGLWKTTDSGVSWKPMTDGKLDTAAVGGVAVCEANPDIVYLTTAEIGRASCRERV